MEKEMNEKAKYFEKNYISWQNGIKHVIGDNDETKKYLKYNDAESINVKTLIKIIGYVIRSIVENHVNYVIAILVSIVLIAISNNDSLIGIRVAGITAIVVIIAEIIYNTGALLFKLFKKKELVDDETAMFLYKSNAGESDWRERCCDFIYKTLEKIDYLDEYENILKFIGYSCNLYVKEVLTSEDFDDFIFSIYNDKEFFESLFSASKTDIPSHFHYYAVAAVCIEIIDREGWFDSIKKFDEFFDHESIFWFWYKDMKSAFESREEDKGDSLYMLTVVGMLLRAKHEIEASLKKD